MQIYFIENNMEVESVKHYLQELYKTTVVKFNTIYDEHVKKNEEKESSIVELGLTIKLLEGKEFETFFIHKCLTFLKQIRSASTNGHTEECVVRGMFDIYYKYCVDFGFVIPPKCCDQIKFETLQINMLQDLMWKLN